MLNRLDILNNITLARKAQPAPISNLQLFVQSSPSARKIREPKLSEMNFCDSSKMTYCMLEFFVSFYVVVSSYHILILAI